MNESREEARSGSGCLGAAIVLVLILAPIFYVLSTAPVVALADRGVIEGHWITTIYAPLIWLCDNSTVVDGFFQWYFDVTGAGR